MIPKICDMIQINKIYSMRVSQSHSQQMVQSTYSSSIRKDVLWNVLEPGDPYDIRKSMIAQFPGDPQTFMGNNLQVICLFQAAEIQRLTEFLDDYKFRYREIQRRELDRHSYEIQIKELIQQLGQFKGYQSENVKLRDFIKKQTTEYETLKITNRPASEQIATKYEGALKQIDMLIVDRNQSNLRVQNLQMEIKSLEAQLRVIETTKNQEIQTLRLSSRGSVSEAELERLQAKYQGEIQNLEFEIKRLRDFNESKNQQISELMEKNTYLVREIQMLNNKKGQQNTENDRYLEERVALLSQEIERLNLILQQSTGRIDEYGKAQLILQQNYRHKQEEVHQFQNRYVDLQYQYQDLQRKFQSQTAELHQLSKQIRSQPVEVQRVPDNSSNIKIKHLEEQASHLRHQLSNFQHRYDSLHKNYQQLEYLNSKYQIIERQNSSMKHQIGVLEQRQVKLAEYENKVAMLSQEVERLSSMLEMQKRNRINPDEIEDMKRKSVQNQRRISQRYQAEIQRRVMEYEGKLASHVKENKVQLEDRLRKINQEVQRLNLYLNEKTQESEAYKQKIAQLEELISKQQREQYQKLNSTNSNYEQTIRELNFKIQKYSDEIANANQRMRNLTEFQEKYYSLTQQYEKLNLHLQQKNSQNDRMRQRVRELEHNQSTWTTSRSQYQSTIREFQFKLDKSAEQLRNADRNNRNLADLQNKNQILTQQIQKMNMMLKNREEEFQNISRQNQDAQYKMKNFYEVETSKRFQIYEEQNNKLLRENQDLQKRLQVIRQLQIKLNDYEQRLNISNLQIEKLNQSLRVKVQGLNQSENTIRNLSMELEKLSRNKVEVEQSYQQRTQMEKMQYSRRVTTYEQNISNIQRQNEELRRKINEINQEYSFKFNDTQNKVSMSGQEIDRLNQALNNINGQYKQSENTIRNQNQQIQNLKRQITQLQNSITQKYEVETSRKISMYEQNTSNLAKELEQTRRRYQELDHNYKQKIDELNQHEQRFRAMTQQFEQYRRQNTEKDNENLRNKSMMENNISNYTRELEELQRRIREYENKLNSLGQENQKLRNQLMQSSQQNQKLRSQLMQTGQEGQNLRRNITQMTKKYEVETSRKISTYQQNINMSNREKEDLMKKIMEMQSLMGVQKREMDEYRRIISELENRLGSLQKQYENAKNNMMNKSQEDYKQWDNRSKQMQTEIQNWRAKYRELQITVTQKYEVETSRKITNYEQNLKNLGAELQNYRMKINELQKIRANNQQQINRLNNHLRSQSEQNQKLVHKIREMQTMITQKYEVQVNRKYTSYQQNIQVLTRQVQENKRSFTNYQQNIQNMNQTIQELRRNLQELQRYKSELENNNMRLKQQNERMNMNLRNKQDQWIKSDAYSKNLMQQLQNLKRQAKDNQMSLSKKYESQNTQIISVYEQNMQKIQRENDELRKVKQNVVYELDGTQRSLRQHMMLWEKERNEFNKRLETQKSEIQSGGFNLNRIKQQLQNKVDLLTKQIQRLNHVLRGKVEEAEHYKQATMKLEQQLNKQKELERHYLNEIQKYTNEINILQRKLTESNSSFNGNLEEFRQLKSAYDLLNQEYDSSKRHLAEYENNVKKLYGEFERLQAIINELKVQRQSLYEKNEGLSMEIDRLTLENRGQQQEIREIRLRLADQMALEKRINEQLSLMVVLFAEIQTLRQRVQDKDREVKEIRRSSMAPLRVAQRFE